MKEYVTEKTTPSDLRIVFEALADSTICEVIFDNFYIIPQFYSIVLLLKALYLQMLGPAFTDEAMVALCFTLVRNKNIVAVNLGEATDKKLTRDGWANFEQALPNTGLVHFYANSLDAQLTAKLKAILRENRKGNKANNDRQYAHMWRLQ